MSPERDISSASGRARVCRDWAEVTGVSITHPGGVWAAQGASQVSLPRCDCGRGCEMSQELTSALGTYQSNVPFSLIKDFFLMHYKLT